MNDINIVKEWFRYSHNDLISARHLFEDLYPKQVEIASYLSQQCAEKALKGFLVYHNVAYPRIHDLKVICNICKQIDASFDTIEAICAHLTPFAVVARYPEELAPEESITKAAIEKAQRIYDFCTMKIPEMRENEGKKLERKE
jgi:HEPN domain-containing protein